MSLGNKLAVCITDWIKIEIFPNRPMAETLNPSELLEDSKSYSDKQLNERVVISFAMGKDVT